MQDRVPLYPGRVKLTPVSGQENTYDMLRADEPTQEGTPLSKSTFLKDTTAALFGLGADAVPDDAFLALNASQKVIANNYVWEKNVPSIDYNETYTDEDRIQSYGALNLVLISDSFSFDNQGKITLVNPTRQYFSDDGISLDNSAVNGKYFFFCYSVSADMPSTEMVYYGGSNTYVYNAVGSDGTLRVRMVTKITNPRNSFSVIGYVNSPDANAYPPAESDGYNYTPLGKIGAKCQIATGSYVGTGTYGSSNPNSLTFDFEPKFLMIAGNTGNGIYRMFLVIGWDLASSIEDGSGYSQANNITWNGNIVNWYSSSNEYVQLNASGITYNYFAIG